MQKAMARRLKAEANKVAVLFSHKERKGNAAKGEGAPLANAG